MVVLDEIDPRVEDSAVWLFERIVATGSVTLRKASEDRAGEVRAQRCLSSPRLTVDWIFRSAGSRTMEACGGRRVVVAQDTSEINFSRSARRRGLGPGGDGKTPGFFLHPQIAVDAESEAVLGLVGGRIWTREAGKATSRKKRTIEDKESHRWLEGAHVAAERLGDAAQVVVVGDQESDLWEHFARRPGTVELLVRARHDRALAGGGKLFGAPDEWLELETCEIAIAPRRIGQKPRTATVAVRAGRLDIRQPAGAGSDGPEQLTLSLVEVREVNPPPPGYEPVQWRLLTTLPAPDAAAAMEIVNFYRLRWRIEEVFRALKKDGLGLEQSQVYDREHLFRLTALALAAAVRTLQLVDARDGGPRPMSDVLDQRLAPAVAALNETCEGSTPRQKNPHPEGSLAWLSWVVARYGGWNCYYKPPGPKTIADGWQRFCAALSGYLTATGELP